MGVVKMYENLTREELIEKVTILETLIHKMQSRYVDFNNAGVGEILSALFNYSTACADTDRVKRAWKRLCELAIK